MTTPPTAVAVPSPGETARRVQTARDEVARRLTPERVGGVVDVLLGKAEGGSLPAIRATLALLRPAGPAVAVQQNTLSVGRTDSTVRKLAALWLYVHRHASAVALSNVVELPLDAVAVALEHEWFQLRAETGEYELTAAGRRFAAP